MSQQEVDRVQVIQRMVETCEGKRRPPSGWG